MTLHDSRPPFDDAGDRALRDLVAAGEIDRATEGAIRRYGPELLGWLGDTLSDADADDAFALMSLELWRSLARYEGRCSLRTWCYMLARQAASKIRTEPRRRQEVLVSHVPSIVAAVTHVWSTTRRRERVAGEVFAEIRRALDDDDQALLVLRVDRGLAWRDIAQVFLGEDAAADDLTRHAAQLRKQFERLKVRLRGAAAERGLG